MGARVHADSRHRFKRARLRLRGVHVRRTAVRDWVRSTALPPYLLQFHNAGKRNPAPVVAPPEPGCFRVRGGRPQPSKHRKLLTTPLPLSKSLLQLAKLSGQLHPGTGRAVQFTGGQHPPQILDKQRVVRLTI